MNKFYQPFQRLQCSAALTGMGFRFNAGSYLWSLLYGSGRDGTDTPQMIKTDDAADRLILSYNIKVRRIILKIRISWLRVLSALPSACLYFQDNPPCFFKSFSSYSNLRLE